MTDTGDIRIDKMMPRLCETWPIKPFEECLLPCEVQYEKLKGKDIQPSGRIPVIDQGESFISGYTDDAKNEYSGRLPVIIFGDHTRRFKFVDFKFAVGADGTRLLYPFKVLEPRFFFHYLCVLNLESQGYSRHYKFLKEVSVPIPPLPEQRRIVAKLEKLLNKVDALHKRLAKIPSILKRLRQSVLAAACSGRLTADWRDDNEEAVVVSSTERPDDIPYDIPKTWGWIKWGALVTQERHSFKRGPFGSALKKEIFVPSGYKIYEQCNPINDNCELGNYFITKEKFRELEAFKVAAGDLLISCSGTLGRITRIPELFHEGIINQALLKVTLDKQKILNEYFIRYFRSKRFQTLIFDSAQGSAQANIKGVKELKALPVPLPPFLEQKEIIRRVESIFKLTDKIESRYAKAKSQVDKLTQSILAKAFRGDLVPQDPNDEPASSLLERIKTQKKKDVSKITNVSR